MRKKSPAGKYSIFKGELGALYVNKEQIHSTCLHCTLILILISN